MGITRKKQIFLTSFDLAAVHEGYYFQLVCVCMCVCVCVCVCVLICYFMS